MSDGSYNYLCYQLDAQGHLNLADLEAMRDRLVEIAPDAAATLATTQLHEMLSRPAGDGLTDVWRAVEWCDSGDSLMDRVKEALAEYESSAAVPRPEAPESPYKDVGLSSLWELRVAGREYIDGEPVWLTAADLEPPPSTTIEMEDGQRWTRHPGMTPGSWLVEGGEADSDPETWRKVAGNYGPVRIVKL